MAKKHHDSKHHTLVDWLHNHHKSDNAQALHKAYKHYKHLDPNANFHEWLQNHHPHLAHIANHVLNSGSGHGGGGGGGQGGGGGNHWGQHDQNALQMLKSLFASYGLGGDAIVHWIKNRILDGDSMSVIQAEIQTQDFWKKRFEGNEMLQRKGLNVLSVQEYLATETAMTAALRSAGFPAGFYDDRHDLAEMIGNQLSPSEVAQRAAMWSDLVNREDPTVLEALRQRGIGKGDLAAYLMDPKRAMPLLTNKYQSTLIGAAAARAGIGSSVDYADMLAARGVSEQEAATGYGTIASILPTLDNLADIYGMKYNQSLAEREVFENNADAAQRRKLISGMESAEFAGQSGVSQGSLAKQTAGTY